MSIASITRFVRTRPSEYVRSLEYNVDDLFKRLDVETDEAKDAIVNKMIENDFIGKKMDYIPESCLAEFISVVRDY